MPRHSPYRIELTDEERAVLERLARSYTLPYWQVMRAQMVLMAAEGMRNDQIAARLGGRAVAGSNPVSPIETPFATASAARRQQPPKSPAAAAFRAARRRRSQPC